MDPTQQQIGAYQSQQAQAMSPQNQALYQALMGNSLGLGQAQMAAPPQTGAMNALFNTPPPTPQAPPPAGMSNVAQPQF